jgi:predicted MPP superfamily phosphohydrolase
VPQKPNLITRRHAIKALAVAGSGTLALGLYAWRVEPHWIELTHATLPIRGLATELEGCTLAQISDIHVGPKVDDGYIIETFQ